MLAGSDVMKRRGVYWTLAMALGAMVVVGAGGQAAAKGKGKGKIKKAPRPSEAKSSPMVVTLPPRDFAYVEDVGRHIATHTAEGTQSVEPVQWLISAKPPRYLRFYPAWRTTSSAAP